MLAQLREERRDPSAAEVQRLQPTPAQDVAAWDPETGTWRVLSPAPASGQRSSFRYPTVWTGEEIVTWHVNSRGAHSGDLLLLNPLTGEWRRAEAAPTGILAETPEVWTGAEMIIVSGEQVNETPMECCVPKAIAISFTP